MDTAITNGLGETDFVPASRAATDPDGQAEIDVALAPIRGTVYGLLAAAALWAVILVPVWFLL